jgi:hypothetical protein
MIFTGDFGGLKRYKLLVELKSALAKAAENHFALVPGRFRISPNRLYSDLGGFFQRISIDAGADTGEGDGFEIIHPCDFQGIPITVAQQPWFALVASVPYRADGVNDELGREFIAASEFRLAGGAAMQRAAFGQ